VRLAIRRRRLLIGCVAAGAVAGVVATLVTPRQYASTARLQISREAAQVVNLGAVSRDVSIGDQEFYQTQYSLLRAQALAERVARDLNVVDDPAFFRAFRKSDEYDGNTGAAGRAKRNEAAGHILLDNVEVAPIHGSSLVDVQARAPSPALSQKIAQTWAQDFIASNLERRLAPSAYARQFLEARLEQLRGRLEASERRAVDYAAAHGIIDLPPPTNTSKSSNTPTTTTDFSQSRSLITDDLVALNAEREAAAADSIKAASDLAAFDKQPDAGKDTRARAALQQASQAAKARQEALTRQVEALKASFADLRQRAIQYNIYQRDAQTNHELYDALLQRYKEIGVAGAAESNNVAVVDAAALPDQPSSPRLSINLALFTLAGAILGSLIAAVLEQFDDGPAEPPDSALPESQR
jgi:uncharacterized protein involved in exopolysaccharide biosynthesis